MLIKRIPRLAFLQEYWDYKPGEHVSLIAPTQNGKTTMIWDLLKHTDTSWCSVPPVMLVAKPKDPVVYNALDQMDYSVLKDWPPRKKWFSQEVPAGYGLWPPHLMDVPSEVNNAHLAERFKPAISDLFWRGDSILIADEIYFLCAELSLSKEMTRYWTQGHGMGAGLWTAGQKPSGTQQGTVPSFIYNSPTHTFLGRDPDEKNRKRFGEIGGISPRLVEEAVAGLAKYEWLYIHRDGPTYCIVQA
ncbi:hypothetical protein [Actinomadura violacea]|uniref:Uncharacterized protein n=1 Tax=Actinomadura violacea TaxID=2819934 RepID=A0ABS3RW45_9ACTN|nr:hypothetical protein [Actinomadura violacea]MBO2460979.1 hypothetical protein [Actinomadura violacea]